MSCRLQSKILPQVIRIRPEDNVQNMNRARIAERIDLLSRDKKAFKYYLDFFYQNETFIGPSIYFHKRVINLIRTNSLLSLLENEHFIEYIYATLASWGMHRMGEGGSKMRDFAEFKQSIISSSDMFLELGKLRLDTLTEDNKKHAFSLLGQLFTSLRVMESDSNLVGNSKVIHHILPDLVPPIDRQYTIRFFYGNLKSKYSPMYDKEEEAILFADIMNCFYTICRRLSLTENDFDKTRPMNTSIPKVIDNAIIGFVLSENSKQP
jgi:hypothetical protein